MIGVLTHHWAKPDKAGEARQLLDRNGRAQSEYGGFGGRQTFLTQRPSEDYDASALGKLRNLRCLAGQSATRGSDGRSRSALGEVA
jgi:hypothetical protein